MRNEVFKRMLALLQYVNRNSGERLHLISKGFLAESGIKACDRTIRRDMNALVDMGFVEVLPTYKRKYSYRSWKTVTYKLYYPNLKQKVFLDSFKGGA